MILLFKSLDFHRIETFFAPLTVIVVAFFVAWVMNIVIRSYMRRNARLLKADPTNYSFVQHAISLVTFFGAVLFVFYNIPELHNIGKTLFAGAGILAAIIGFASQEAFSNIISGIFIVIYKPFRVGDSIKLLSNNQAGKVEDITLRHTIIKGAENRRIMVPNSVISREQILNSSIKDTRINLFLDINIEYTSDHNRALAIMKEEAAKHPLFLDGRSIKQKMEGAEAVSGKVIALANDGIHLRTTVWARNDDEAYDMKCDLLKMVLERFEKEGIKVAEDE